MLISVSFGVDVEMIMSEPIGGILNSIDHLLRRPQRRSRGAIRYRAPLSAYPVVTHARTVTSRTSQADARSNAGGPA